MTDVRLDDRKESTGKYQENPEKFTGNYRKINKKVLGMRWYSTELDEVGPR